jgi:hypothetical protein
MRPASSPLNTPPSPRSTKEFLFQLAIQLAVAILVGVSTYLWTTLHEKKKIEEAPTIYVNELDKLINTAAAEGEENATLNARAIVAARNSLASSLTGIGSQLDSQIDLLAQEVGSATLEGQGFAPRLVSTPAPPGSRPISSAQVYQQIKLLQKVWPAKKRQIEIEIRKLLAELGLGGSGG